MAPSDLNTQPSLPTLGSGKSTCTQSQSHIQSLPSEQVPPVPLLPGARCPATTDDGVDPDLVDWDGPHDPENPKNWSASYRWAISMLNGLVCINVTFASTAPSTAAPTIAAFFGKSNEVGFLVTSLFLLGYVAGPVIWGPTSELLGRRRILIFSLSLYTLFILGQSLAHNIQTLLVTRFFSGFFASCPMSNSGGLVADLWTLAELGLAINIVSTAVSLGPVIGPLVAGFMLDNHVDWRWIFWVMMIFAGVCTFLVAVFLPETYAPTILERKARRLRAQDPERFGRVYAPSERVEWTPGVLFEKTIKRPITMLFVEPILLLATLYTSLVYGILYGLFEALPIVFQVKRGFTDAQSGLIFLGVGIGLTFASAYDLYSTRRYPSLVRTWRGFPPPEERLYGAMAGAPMLVIGAFWLGWTGQYPAVHWVVPALSTIVIGTAFSLVFISFLSYIVDTYVKYAASALGANTMVRSIVGAAFPLFIPAMFDGIGINWSCTLIGLVALLLAPSPYLFFHYGRRIRRGSRFAPCIDLKIAKEIEEERAREEQVHDKP